MAKGKCIVVLTGAGISAESGLSTFRDSGGLWEQYDIYEVATPEAWQKNPELVLEFYNARRRQVLEAQPNAAHLALAAWQEDFEVDIITQNVDDLHERAGSKRVLHLHGELLKVRSTVEPSLVYSWSKDLHWGDCCEKGSQLRPHRVVWRGGSPFAACCRMGESGRCVARSRHFHAGISCSRPGRLCSARCPSVLRGPQAQLESRASRAGSFGNHRCSGCRSYTAFARKTLGLKRPRPELFDPQQCSFGYACKGKGKLKK